MLIHFRALPRFLDFIEIFFSDAADSIQTKIIYSDVLQPSNAQTQQQ